MVDVNSVQPFGDTGRRIVPGAAGGVVALAIAILLARQTDAPFLGTILTDASTSVLSTEGFSTFLDIVGQAGKAAALAVTITLQFLCYTAIWAWVVGRMRPSVGWEERREFAAIQLGLVFALFVAAAAIFDLLAQVSVLDAGRWGTYLWQTFLLTVLYVVISHASDAAWAGYRPRRPRPVRGAALSRRRFLVGSGSFGISIVAAVYLGRSVWDTTRTGVRRVINGRLPDSITSNDDFYTVSKNFFDPRVDGDAWRLELAGLVDNKLSLTLADLRALPREESINTLICISYELGDQLISNARWGGTSLRTVLELAGVQPEATHVIFNSADDYLESHRLEYAMDPEVRLVWEMNGEPLPEAHGYPLRLLAPGRYGIKNPKWITRIILTSRNVLGFWQQRGWSQEGRIQTMSRIDVPAGGRRTVPGSERVQGIAFAGDRRIAGVEVSTDDGETWAPAELREELGPLAWRFWSFDFDASPEEHLLAVRAVDGDGVPQIAEIQPALPDGSTGYHRRRLLAPRDP